MSNRLESRRKPKKPRKICNFVGRVRGSKVFIGNFTYEYDFVVLTDTTSVIVHYLGLVVFGKPFVEKTGLIYDKEEGTVLFEKDNEKFIFKMPHKMEMFKHIDFKDIKTDCIPPFFIEGDDNHEKTYYSDSLNLGPKYKYDESVSKAIQGLMKIKSERSNQEGVTSSVKLLLEIKGLLLVKPNCERLFRDTVFGPWLDIQSHDKDSHMMHYVLQHQLSNPNVALISSPEEMRQAWFMASVNIIKGLANQDGKFFHDDKARVNCIEHNNGMCGDTEVAKFVQDEEARVNGIGHHNEMCGDIEDGSFVEGIDETICLKSNQMLVEEGDDVLDFEGDGVHLSQTNDVIQQEPSSHLDDLIEIDGENVKDGFTISQDHLHLLIKALESKT
uniref:Phospholipase-like protein n=1 Tax=Tanacetum cinerariifolium TaxID=118510 RepID=A0A699GR39_TANCI|nr:phospholipase-like protein [Tanacetum cinerariifolium]